MSVVVHLSDVLDPVYVQGDFNNFVEALNLTAVQGKQYVVVQEEPSGDPVAIEQRAIKIVRPGADDAFVGG